MATPWKELADTVLATIRDHTADFLENNQAAKDIIEERAKKLAEYSMEYVTAANETERTAIMVEMEIVKQTIVNELAAAALNGQTASIATFKEVVNTALTALLKYLPVILSAI